MSPEEKAYHEFIVGEIKDMWKIIGDERAFKVWKFDQIDRRISFIFGLSIGNILVTTFLIFTMRTSS